MKVVFDTTIIVDHLRNVNEISKKAGEFKRKYNVSLDDCIIAATAAIQNAKLWTKNLKDFQKIKEIEVEEPY
jgi:predicted nucleic acid-binding protein